MSSDSEPKRFAVERTALPPAYPTHLHSPAFWEALGRTVATFGFLEETLGRAIFAFTGTREIADEDIDAAFQKWLPTLERALNDPLGGLIDSYATAVRDHASATLTNPGDLVEDLRKAAVIRNVLCHGSWRAPDAQGRSLPHFVNRKMEAFQTPVDVAFLLQVQEHVVELTCTVITSVTHMGWQFPGSGGPGIPIIATHRRDPL